MKIVIPGGTGQIGAVLARAFLRDDHEVVILSRQRPSRTTTSAKHVPWDGATLGDWAAELDGCDVVINLAGRSVNCRYSAQRRSEILDSRVRSTRVIAEAIAGFRRPPRIWLQASTATIYSHRFDAPNDEWTGIIGGDESTAPSAWAFSIAVARAWEQAVDHVLTPHTRKVILRSAMTMSPDEGGIFDTLLALVRHGLGGTAGDGRQFVSWIHYEDFVAAIRWLIDRDDLAGVVNIASPNPLPNEDFMRELRQAAGVSVGLPATRWMLEIGALFMRTESELILKSRRVVPARLLESGFTFEFAHWRDAARDLYRQWSAPDFKAA